LLTGGGVEVEGVVGAGEEFVDVEVAALGRGRDDRVPVDVEQGLGGAVDRAHGVVGAAGAGRPGIQGLLVADLHQRGGDVIHVLDVHPAGHVGHASPRPGRGKEENRQELGAQELPVVGVVSSMALDVGGISEHAADPSGVAVGVAVRERRPASAWHAR
jgi:hypothetical protein